MVREKAKCLMIMILNRLEEMTEEVGSLRETEDLTEVRVKSGGLAMSRRKGVVCVERQLLQVIRKG